MILPAYSQTEQPALIPFKNLFLKIIASWHLLIWMACGSTLAFSKEKAVETPSDPQKVRQILLLLSDQTLRIEKELDEPQEITIYQNRR